MRVAALIRSCLLVASAIAGVWRGPCLRSVRRQSRDVSRARPRAAPDRRRPQGRTGHGLFLDDRRPGAAPDTRRLRGEISVHEAAIRARRPAAAVAEGAWRKRAPAAWWPTCWKAPAWKCRFAPPTSISRSGRRRSKPTQPERRDPQNFWAPTRFSYLGACYNTNLVKPGDLPKSFDDFLDPKWKGKIAWSGTVIGAMLFITGVRNFMGEEKALAYLQKLAKQDIAPIAIGQSRRRRPRHGRRIRAVPRCLPASSDHQRAQGRAGGAAAARSGADGGELGDAAEGAAASVFGDAVHRLSAVEGRARRRLQGADYFPARPDVSSFARPRQDRAAQDRPARKTSSLRRR